VPDAPLVKGDAVIVVRGRYKNKRGAVDSVSPKKCKLLIGGTLTGDLLFNVVRRVASPKI
jgi:ribosomal protein L24